MRFGPGQGLLTGRWLAMACLAAVGIGCSSPPSRQPEPVECTEQTASRCESGPDAGACVSGGFELSFAHYTYRGDLATSDLSGFGQFLAEAAPADDYRVHGYGFSWGDLLSDFRRVPVGGCEPVFKRERPAVLDPGITGGLTGPGGELTLRADEPSGFYNGVERASTYVPGALYRLRAGGSASVGQFEVEIRAPGELAWTSPVWPVFPVKWLVAQVDEGLEVTWESAGGDSDVIVEVVEPRDASLEALRFVCRFEDNGNAVVPAEVLASFHTRGSPRGDAELHLFTYRTYLADVPCLPAPVAILFDTQWSAILRLEE